MSSNDTTTPMTNDTTTNGTTIPTTNNPTPSKPKPTETIITKKHEKYEKIEQGQLIL
ncbi:hypothetical protein C2G38_2167775 [Gigaspora rosea]|uniref:Uncharacterized protein n=1 Tax=Gigaspora rosea TaxID=44941 RepID=A0A397W096_9GLOM|nr:hypothetical protein C2G38_2167775 [Gigaspora rosea]